jgi:hypothetical protein
MKQETGMKLVESREICLPKAWVYEYLGSAREQQENSSGPIVRLTEQSKSIGVQDPGNSSVP